MSAALLKSCMDKAQPYQNLKLHRLPVKDHMGLETHRCIISVALQSQLCVDARGTLGPVHKHQYCASPLGSDGSEERKETPFMFSRVLQSRIFSC